MRTALVVWVVLLGLLAICAAGAEEPGKVKLVYKFEPGQALSYWTEITGSGTTTMAPKEGGESQTTPMELSGGMAMVQRVVEVDEDGIALLEMTSDGMAMHMRMNQGGMVMDVDMKIDKDGLVVKGPAGEQRISLAEAGMDVLPLIGQPMQMRMKPTGEVLSFSADGMEALTRTLGMDMSQIVKTSETPFPDRELSVGESWDYKIDMPVPGAEDEAEIVMKAKLVGVDESAGGGVARIKVDGSVDLSGMTMDAPAPGGGAGEKLTFDVLKETISGEFSFDIGRGCMTKAVYDMNLETSMDMPGPQPGTMSTQMDMQVKMSLM